MIKIYNGLVVFLLALLLLAGCGTAEQAPEEAAEQEQTVQTEEETTEEVAEEEAGETAEQEEAVQITISENNGEEIIAEEEIPVEEGAVLFDVMEENFDIEATDDGFITSIEGVSQDEENQRYWMFYVDGELAPVGAQEYELESGDEVTFDLQAME